MNTKIISLKTIQDVVKEVQQFYLYDNDLAFEDDAKILKSVSTLSELTGNTLEVSNTLLDILDNYVAFVDVEQSIVDDLKKEWLVQVLAHKTQHEHDIVFDEVITKNSKEIQSRHVVIMDTQVLIVDYIEHGQVHYLDLEGMPVSVAPFENEDTYLIGRIVI